VRWHHSFKQHYGSLSRLGTAGIESADVTDPGNAAHNSAGSFGELGSAAKKIMLTTHSVDALSATATLNKHIACVYPLET
jgi:hypothetical protein